MSVIPFTASEALCAATDDVTKVLTIEKKKNPGTYMVTYLNVYWNIGSFTRREGWFYVKNIELTAGIADPSRKTDPRNSYPQMRFKLQTTLSKCGKFGQFLNLIQQQWRNQINDLIDKRYIDVEGKKIHDLLQYNVSKKNSKNPGAPIEDPIIRFSIDFKTFPKNYRHVFLQNKPRTQFFDAKKKYINNKGETKYEPATITNDDGTQEPITADNVHKFVITGSKIISAIIMITSASVSDGWISLPLVAHEVVIEQGSGEGFEIRREDDDEDDSDSKTVITTTSNSTQEVTTNSNTDENFNIDEITNVLSSINTHT